VTGNQGSQPEDTSREPDEFLPPEEPAPHLTAGSSPNSGQESLDRLLAPVVVRLIFQLGTTLSTPEIWRRCPSPSRTRSDSTAWATFWDEGPARKASDPGQVVVPSPRVKRTL
jgi:hypothetical protein